MMRLYDIANEYQNILNELYDPETGEVNESALLKLEQVETSLDKKAIALASFIRNMDAEKEAIKAAKDQMALREKRLNKRIESLEEYLQSNMERCGISHISCPHFEIKLKKCPASVDVENEEMIPEEYKRIVTETRIDKVKIKEEISLGVVIPGASLKNRLRLEIK